MSRDSTWEYYVIQMSVYNIQQVQNKLNDLGTVGWEMCGVDPGNWVYLKRAK